MYNRRIVSFLLVVVVMLAAVPLIVMAQDGSGDDEVKSPNDLAIQFVYNAFNEKDLAAVADFVSPEFVLHQNSATNPFGEGIQGFATWITVLTTIVPDWNIVIQEEIAQDDLNATLWSLTGTHTGELQFPDGRVLPPTGNEISLEGLMMARIEDGKISELWIYFDLLEWEIATGQLAAPDMEMGMDAE
jgi:predicted ester cyclase